MSPMTIEAPTAAEAMRSLPDSLPLESTVAEARERMREEDVSFLAVVSPETQKLLGIVTRSVLERACASGGHDPATCPVVRHLEADAEFCFEEESAAEVLRPEVGSRPVGDPRTGARTPVVVVNAQKVPIGYLER
jgi:CBS domain-containing protein